VAEGGRIELAAALPAAYPRRETARLELSLENAHRLIHILVSREGGSTLITPQELAATPTPWLTTQLADGGLEVRAR
jgi:hypothetical protein